MPPLTATGCALCGRKLKTSTDLTAHMKAKYGVSITDQHKKQSGSYRSNAYRGVDLARAMAGA